MQDNILKELVSINTVADKENSKFREKIKEILSPLNFTFEELGEENKVLLAKRGTPNLAFISHTDTVDASPEWTKNPFLLTEDDTYYYGLGVSDMKGGIAALLEAVLNLDNNIPCLLIFTYDEEINFTGIKELVGKKEELPPYLIFTEPTDLYPIIANKGCIEFSLKFSGKSAHSSTPGLGENALYKAMDCITEIRNFASQISKESVSIYEVPFTTFNLSKITGGNEINKVPDSCEITFDFRTIKKEHNIKIREQILSLATKYQAEVTILNDISAAMTTDETWTRMLENITAKKTLGLNYSTEASFYPDKKICILGPGPVTAHQKDERISKESFTKAKLLYEKIIKELNKI